nr:phage portal protein [Patulibacter sp. SYSU D01012]
MHVVERRRLDMVRRYWKGRQALPMVIPVNSPREMRVMAASSRVNVLPIVVNSLVQATFVDGFRPPGDDVAADPASPGARIWSAWQRNRWDARQTGVHRAAAAYGAAYVVVTPGDPVPVMRAVSPRSMCAVYGEDPDWPMWALERTSDQTWKLYDEQAVYFLEGGAVGGWKHLETKFHGAGVTPVVRFLDELDLDEDDEPESLALAMPGAEAPIARGQVAPLMALQDQIDLTTFDLQVAQHFGAFKQRYIIGWAADDEIALLKTAANRLVTLDVKPDEVSVGEWTATDVKQFIESRESSLRHAASLSQTPIHELTGDLVNLSAEALAAAEAGKDRKVDERQTLWGEAHEQSLWLVGRYLRVDVPDDAQVVWRDTSARAFAATVDGLGKLAQMLGVPPQELWERIPGVTQADVERWSKAAEKGDAFARLTETLDRQAGDTPPPGGDA